MSKIVVDTRKGKVIITNRLTYPENVNERINNAIKSGMLEGFFPMGIHQKRKETILECVVPGMIPANRYLSGIVTKKMFLDFVHEVALLIKSCEKNMINSHNLDLQLDRVFIDPQSKKVKCIYWPVVNNQLEASPHLFLKLLPYKLKFNPHEDTSYLKTYQAFFGGIDPFSVNGFERMVASLLGKKTSSGHTTPSEALSGALSGNVQMEKKGTSAKSNDNIAYDPFASLEESPAEDNAEALPITFGNFCTKCGYKNKLTSNFCTQCGTKLAKEPPIIPAAVAPVETAAPVEAVAPVEAAAPVEAVAPARAAAPAEAVSAENQPIADEPFVMEPPAEESIVEEPASEAPVNAVECGTTVLGDDLGGTTVLGYEDFEEPVYPTLLRLRTEEVFSINKPSFRIGTEQSYCDLFICDNNYISRSHADIVTREERYYIIDRNSTNKTFVDGKVIPAEKEVEIFSGTQIRLANEDFTFNIEA